MPEFPICQKPLFVRCFYLSDATIFQTLLFVRHPYFSDTPICKKPLFVRRPYWWDAPICQMPFYVGRVKYTVLKSIGSFLIIFFRNYKDKNTNLFNYAVCAKSGWLISSILSWDEKSQQIFVIFTWLSYIRLQFNRTCAWHRDMIVFVEKYTSLKMFCSFKKS